MQQKAFLHVRRVKQWMSFFRRFRVLLDGQLLGRIKNGATQMYEINPGEHELTITIDWVSSEPVKFHCEAGQRVRFVCGHPSPTWGSAVRAGVEAGTGVAPTSLVSSIDLVPDDAPAPKV